MAVKPEKWPSSTRVYRYLSGIKVSTTALQQTVTVSARKPACRGRYKTPHLPSLQHSVSSTSQRGEKKLGKLSKSTSTKHQSSVMYCLTELGMTASWRNNKSKSRYRKWWFPDCKLTQYAQPCCTLVFLEIITLENSFLKQTVVTWSSIYKKC